MTKTKDSISVVCGFENGTIEMMSLSDFRVNSHFKLHGDAVSCVSELSDGSFVSGACDNMVKRWNERGVVLQNFAGHTQWIWGALELTGGTIVSASDDMTLKLWKLSTGECLRTMRLHSGLIYGLVKVSESKFASGSSDKTIRVWDDEGNNVENIHTKYAIQAMARLENAIVTASGDRLEIRQLEYVCLLPIYGRQQLTHFDRYRLRLVGLCCETISKNKEHYNASELKHALPEELFGLCFWNNSHLTSLLPIFLDQVYKQQLIHSFIDSSKLRNYPKRF